MQVKHKKTIFYLRTDIGSENLSAGGSVAHTFGVINGFVKHGHEVLCASSAMFALLKNVCPSFFLSLWLPNLLRVFGFKLSCLFSNFFFTFRCLRFLCKKKIDFIYQRYSMLNFTGLLIAWLKKKPLVLEFNGSEVWVDKHWSKKRRLKLGFLIRWVERWNVRRATNIVVVSQALKDFLVDAGVKAEKILVNPNGVDVGLFDPEKLLQERKTVRKSLGIQEKFVFGFIGSFDAWHGIEVLAAMILEVIKRKKNVHFLLIGSGPLLPYLKKELTKNNIGVDVVTLTGLVVQGKARQYLAACDAFLSPTKPNTDGSRFFGSPTKLFEYMSLGKPIIASDLEQLSELLFPAVKAGAIEVSGKEVGILVQPEDVQGFVDAACMLVELDVRKTKILGSNARKKAKENYSWSTHVEKIISFVAQDGTCTQV